MSKAQNQLGINLSSKFTMLTYNNQISSNCIAIIHCNLTKISARKNNSIHFVPNELYNTIYSMVKPCRTPARNRRKFFRMVQIRSRNIFQKRSICYILTVFAKHCSYVFEFLKNNIESVSIQNAYMGLAQKE